ncbi:calcium-activated potassium channel subunit beta-1 isoform X2 [Manis javanica]|uniref:calcium-activated potassium channel subunit beta-1 isoform X2 n=1 Tax=Manis javanica TaxID=9974 RepID=UPI000813702A
MGKKLVMAQKRGETRALCLGVAMVVCAVITYYILSTTVLPLYLKSVWNQESTCHLIETNIRDQEELEGKKVPQYPCLWVNVSAVGRWAVLYHTEDTRDQNQQPSALSTRQQECPTPWVLLLLPSSAPTSRAAWTTTSGPGLMWRRSEPNSTSTGFSTASPRLRKMRPASCTSASTDPGTSSSSSFGPPSC